MTAPLQRPAGGAHRPAGGRAWTVPELVALRAGQQPERAAIIGSPDRRLTFSQRLTFAQWHERSGAVARGLLARGVLPGERVALVFGGHDWVDYAVAYCAVGQVGAVAVPLSDRSAPPDLAFMLADCGARGVVTGAFVGSGVDVAGVGWRAGVADLATGGEPFEPLARPGDPAQILYTSGTTGRPKGVLASHANVTYGCTVIANRRPLRHSEHFLHAFPIGTNAGQTMLMNAVDAHPTAVCLSRFVPGQVAALIERMRIGTLFVVPSMAIELLRAAVAQRHDLSSVLLLGSTAAALPSAVANELTEVLPAATVVNYYTSTEAAPAQTAMVFDPTHPTSVGRSVSGDLAILDADGRRLPPFAVGEVWMRLPTTPRSYFGDAATTATVFRDGWVRMGDVGHLDDAGRLFLADRESDVIKSGAFEISTLHVESALYEHPDVVEAAVFGTAHPVLGAAVAVAVVATGPLTLPEVRGFLMERVAPHELPMRLLVLDELPRNNGGKVLKRELRALVDGGAEGAGTRDEGSG